MGFINFTGENRIPGENQLVKKRSVEIENNRESIVSLPAPPVFTITESRRGKINPKNMLPELYMVVSFESQL